MLRRMTHMKNLMICASLGILAAACAPTDTSSANAQPSPEPAPESTLTLDEASTAIFAGGCFWCVESDFEKLPGVLEAVSGYTGGTTVNPTYKQVTYEETGHYEAAKIYYDPGIITYEQLVDFFWTSVDPTDPRGQFCDKGSSYRTAIFATPEQMATARQSKAELEALDIVSPIVTPVLEAAVFYDAEDYHQDYYIKNPVRYNFYRSGCGRDGRLKQLWGKNAKTLNAF